MKRFIISAALVSVAACSSEVGSIAEGPNFGNATMNNTQIQTGERSYVIDLAHRFADEVPSTVTFAFDSAQLDSNARIALKEQANWIRQFPEIRFRVFGHTDKVGSSAYNKNLGQRRANAVVAYLSTLGINRSRLEAVVSFGETQPLIVTEGRERRNRRTVTEVTGFVQDPPIPIDGKYAEVIQREYVESATQESYIDTNNSVSGDE